MECNIRLTIEIAASLGYRHQQQTLEPIQKSYNESWAGRGVWLYMRTKEKPSDWEWIARCPAQGFPNSMMFYESGSILLYVDFKSIGLGGSPGVPINRKLLFCCCWLMESLGVANLITSFCTTKKVLQISQWLLILAIVQLLTVFDGASVLMLILVC